MTFLNFSASESCLLGVSNDCEMLLATDPVGLDLRVSPGDLQNPVTCSADLSKFSISKEFVRDVGFPESHVVSIPTPEDIEGGSISRILLNK